MDRWNTRRRSCMDMDNPSCQFLTYMWYEYECTLITKCDEFVNFSFASAESSLQDFIVSTRPLGSMNLLGLAGPRGFGD